jgi:hypothetical protein
MGSANWLLRDSLFLAVTLLIDILILPWYHFFDNSIAPYGTLIQRGGGTGPLKPRQPGK